MWDKPLVLKMQGDTSILELSSPRAAWENGPVVGPNTNVDDHFINKRMPGAEGRDWWGAPSGNIALERMHKGWPKGLEEIRQSLKMLDVPILPKRKRARYGMDGEVDVDRFLFTEPEPFRQHDRVMAPVIKLTGDISANWMTTSETLKWRGAVMVTLAEALSNAGFSVEIVAMHYSERQYKSKGGAGHEDFGAVGGEGDPILGAPPCPSKSLTLLKMKDAAAPINLSILAGSLFTTAAFRVAMWRGWYHAPWPITGGHGRCIPIPEKLWGDIFVPETVIDQVSAQKFLSELPTCKRSDLKKFLIRGGR